MKRIWKVFDSFGKYVLVIAVLGIMISCTGQVIARFVFNSSIRWSNEVARYLLCYLTFIGAFVLIKEKNFIKMDVLEAKVTPQARPYYDVIMEILMISYALVIMIYGNELALKNANQRSSTLHIPKDILYMIIPISGGCMIINSLRNIVDSVRKILKKGEKE